METSAYPLLERFEITMTEHALSRNDGSYVTRGVNWVPGARFWKVPIINGPGKLSPFTLKIEVSIVLHLA